MVQRYRRTEEQKLADGLVRNQQDFDESGRLETKVKTFD